MKPVALTDNGDGTWTARIFRMTYHGSREGCVGWLWANGEMVPPESPAKSSGEMLSSVGGLSSPFMVGEPAQPVNPAMSKERMENPICCGVPHIPGCDCDGTRLLLPDGEDIPFEKDADPVQTGDIPF